MNLAWLLAEFIGTFALTFIGPGSIILNELTGGAVGLLGIALAHGLTLGTFISGVGHISGGKLNPAVSLGLVAGGKLDIITALKEIVAQVAGAVFAAYLLHLIYPANAANAVNLGTPSVGGGVSPGIAALLEAILSFFLVFTVFATAIDKKGAWPAIAGYGIGLTVVFGILAGAGLTGAALNPARAFGPALVSGHWLNQWVWWVGPIAGGLVAGLLYSQVFLRREEQRV